MKTKIPFYFFILLLIACSCNKGECPTTDKKFFLRGVPTAKTINTGYKGGTRGWVNPYKQKAKKSKSKKR